MTHQELHEEALKLAKTYRETDRRIVHVMSLMWEKRSFYELGYTSIFDYCMNALDLSEAQSFYIQKVTRKSEAVPALAQAVQQGELSLNRARRIETVVTNENCKDWMEKAKTLSQRELEKEVSKANLNARKKPNQLLENIERLKELLACGKNEALLKATEALLDKIDPERKAKRAEVSSRKPGKPQVAKQTRQPIPAAVKHEVVRRHGYKCAECQTSRHLHFHHKKPVSEGGLNTPDNLILLCSGHHRVRHTAGTGLKAGFRATFAPS